MDRADSLADWHHPVVGRLQDTEAIALLDRLVMHPALAGPEQAYLAAVLADRRGETEHARELIGRCLAHRPGDERFRETARRLRAA